MHPCRHIPLMGLLLLLHAPSARAAWPEIPTGLAVSTAFSDQHLPVSIADGSGGSIVAWADLRSGEFDIRAQRIGPAGQLLWDAAGIALCSASGQQVFPVIASDGAGGAIVAWEDARSGSADVYAQRIDAAGHVLWAANGVPVCAALDDQVEIAILAGAAGSALVSWTDLRGGLEADVYMQRIDAAGLPLWTPGGVAVCRVEGDQYGPAMASDGAGGAIVSWSDTRVAGTQQVRAARVTATGALPWTAGGVLAATTSGIQAEPAIATDGAGGATIAWSDTRAGATDVFVQRLNTTGARLWGDSARVVCNAVSNQQAPRIVRLASGWCLVWEDGRGTSPDLYAQRLDAAGLAQWTGNGVLVAGGPGTQDRPHLMAGSGDEALLVWQDRRAGSLDIYAQRLQSNGTPRWGANGLAVCTVSGDQRFPVIATDGAGGALVVWEDQREFATDLYAHRVMASGLLGGPEPVIVSVADEPGDEGGWIRVNWTRSRFEDPVHGSTVTRYRVERLDAGGPVAIDSLSVTLGQGPAVLTLLVPTLADASAADSARTRVRIVAIAGASTYASAPDCASSLDNLGPLPVTDLSAHILGGSTRLTWRRSASADVAYYRVHRGSFIAFPADGGSLVGITSDTLLTTAYTASAYYKVIGVDDHENAGGEALTMSQTALGTAEDRLVFEFARPSPDPSRGPLTLAFSLPSPAEVRLELFDASGRRVRALVAGPLPAGRHRMRWDGRDDAGHAVAASVLYARLRAGSESVIRRITRVR